MVFISYSQKDKEIVKEIVTKLSKENIDVWIDYESLNLEKPIKPQLIFAIKSADKFILFDTTNSRESIWVKFELKAAYKNLDKNNILQIPPYSVDELYELLIKGNSA